MTRYYYHENSDVWDESSSGSDWEKRNHGATYHNSKHEYTYQGRVYDNRVTPEPDNIHPTNTTVHTKTVSGNKKTVINPTNKVSGVTKNRNTGGAGFSHQSLTEGGDSSFVNSIKNNDIYSFLMNENSGMVDVKNRLESHVPTETGKNLFDLAFPTSILGGALYAIPFGEIGDVGKLGEVSEKIFGKGAAKIAEEGAGHTIEDVGIHETGVEANFIKNEAMTAEKESSSLSKLSQGGEGILKGGLKVATNKYVIGTGAVIAGIEAFGGIPSDISSTIKQSVTGNVPSSTVQAAGYTDASGVYHPPTTTTNYFSSADKNNPKTGGSPSLEDYLRSGVNPLTVITSAAKKDGKSVAILGIIGLGAYEILKHRGGKKT